MFVLLSLADPEYLKICRASWATAKWFAVGSRQDGFPRGRDLEIACGRLRGYLYFSWVLHEEKT